MHVAWAQTITTRVTVRLVTIGTTRAYRGIWKTCELLSSLSQRSQRKLHSLGM
jgi:hypothetical protein